MKPSGAWRRGVPVASLSLLISGLLVAVGIYVAYEWINWREIAAILLQFDVIWLLAAVLAYWALYPLNSLRFQYVTTWVASPSDPAISLKFIFKLTCSAGFVAVVAPMGLVADAAKIGALRAFRRISLTEATRYTLFDRIIAVQWISLLGLVSFPVQALYGIPARMIGYQALLFCAALAAIGVLIVLPKWLGSLPIKNLAKLVRLFADYKSVLTARASLVQLVIGLLNLVLVFATLYCLLRAARLTADPWIVAGFVPLLQFVNAIPFLYLGWGGREIAIAATLGTVAGLSLNEALAVSAMWGAVLIATGLINGIFLVGNWQAYRHP